MHAQPVGKDAETLQACNAVFDADTFLGITPVSFFLGIGQRLVFRFFMRYRYAAALVIFSYPDKAEIDP